MSESFYTKVVGVTANNNDGYSRQNLIRRFVKPGDVLFLIREKDNSYDSNAIAVHVVPIETIDQDDQIGYLSREVAAELAPKMDRGDRITCITKNKTGGRNEKNFGVNVEITIYTPEEAAIISNRVEAQKATQAARKQTPALTNIKTSGSASKRKRILLGILLTSIGFLCICCLILIVISQIQQ